MNKLLFLFCLWTGVFFPLPEHVENSIPDSGLVAYYSFNDCQVTDITGNGSDGKILGSGGDCRCGVEGNGILLDGQTDYIEFSGPINDYFTTSDFTLSFYFKPIGQSIFKQSLVGKRTTCEDDHALDVMLDMRNEMMLTDFIEEEFIAFGDLSAGLDAGGWHHYALVRNGFRAYTYINGKLMNEARKCSGVDIANDTPLSIGNSPCVGSGARRFNGVVDELRLYEKPMSAQKIMSLYSKTKVEDAEKGCVS